MKIKQSIQTMKPYNPKYVEATIRLDANEQNTASHLTIDQNVLSTLNRYPQHQSNMLIESISKTFKIDSQGIILGSGSSELLELVMKTYIEKDDIVLTIQPTFVMYEHYTRLNMGRYETVKESDHVLEDLLEAYKTLHPKLIIISNPNNPTGAYIDKSKLLTFIQQVSALVIVDEAYIEFVDDKASLVYEVNQFPNLIVTRSFSKAMGLAGARLGYLVTNDVIKNALMIGKTPYSLSTLSQYLGVEVLKKWDTISQNIESIKIIRDEFIDVLLELGIQTPRSYGNFVYLFEPNKPLFDILLQKSILIRHYQNGYYRITIGTKEDMHILTSVFKEIYHVSTP